MKNRQNLWQQITEAADLPGEEHPGESVVEILGDCRVLIERHRGVREYSRESVAVNVKCGTVSVSGCGLELCSMTRHQLVICGKIHSVTVHRRG